MKNVLFSLMIILLCILLFNTNAVFAADRDSCDIQLPGDANGDGLINTSDMITIYDILSKLDIDVDVPLSNADPDGNCIVDTNDIAYLREFIFNAGPEPVECTCVNPDLDTCQVQTPGDADNNDVINVSDATRIINLLSKPGIILPVPLANADPNGDCVIDTTDATYIIDFVFTGGPDPVECTCVNPDLDTCQLQTPGDANEDGNFNTADIVKIYDILSDPNASHPSPLANADPNGDCVVDTNDMAYLSEFLFNAGPAPVDCTCREPVLDTCQIQIPGDANRDGTIDSADAEFIFQFLTEAYPIDSTWVSDPNGDKIVDINDVYYIYDYLTGGPPPVACTDRRNDVDTCSAIFPGDVNCDGEINTDDTQALIAFLHTPLTPKPCAISYADPNGDCVVDDNDIAYLINYLNAGGPAPVDCTCRRVMVSKCGDVNYDFVVDISDAVYVVNYSFGGGRPPTPSPACGDANGDASVDISDAVYIINFAFGGGPTPGDCSPGLIDGGDCGPYR